MHRKPSKVKPKATSNSLTIELPYEFTELCKADGVAPKTVLRGFIADLCGIMNFACNPRPDGYGSHGSDERRMAYAYYERCGYCRGEES
jgi:hypothetical protein